MMNKRCGISLITLIVTIVVLIILSGGVILTLNNTGVIGKTKETKFKTDLKSYDEEIRQTLGSEYTHDSSVVNRVITKRADIEKYCKGLVDSEHLKYAYISEGVLTLRGNKITETQRKWAEEAKIKIDNGEEIIVSDNEIITSFSETEWTKNDVTLTIVGLKDKNVKLHKKPYSFDNGLTWVDENSKIYEQNTSGIYLKVRDEYEYVYANPEIIIDWIDKVPPTDPQEISVIQGLNTLTVMASRSVDNESGMDGYKYSIDGYTWTVTVPENETYIFDKLQPNTNITVYAKAVDKVGNESTGSKEIETSTLEPNSNITITLSTEEWTKGPISATISCDNIPLNYVLQYKLSEDTNYTSGSIIPEIKKNTTISARLYYEEINSEIAKTEKVVENIDDKAPSKPTGISVTTGVNTLEVKAYGSVDNESGMSGYQYKLGENGTWSNVISTNNSYTFDSIKSSTNVTIYARAVDNVGNISSEEDGITNVGTSTNTIDGKVAITLEYISGVAKYNNWTKKINVRFYHGSIPEGYELVYKLSSGSPTTFTTIANNSVITLDYNTTVTATLYNKSLNEEVSNTLNSAQIGIIDNEPPTNYTLSIVTQNANSLVVKASGSTDIGCGLAGYQYSINGTSWSSTIASGTNYTISGLTVGTSYTVYSRAIDNLGNVTDQEQLGNQKVTTRTLYQYTVSYNKNTTATVNNLPANQTKTENITLTLNATKPTRTGYTFAGWATSASGAKAYDAGGSYTANSGATLYAIWTINKYTLTLNANGGSVSPTSISQNYGTSITLPTPSRTGYKFNGWYTAASGGSKVTYTTMPATNQTLYAQWTINKYTLTFNANGGSVTPTSISQNYGTSITMPTPTRNGYGFNGWYTATSGGSKVTYTTMPAANQTLYAQWTLLHTHTASCYHSHSSSCYSYTYHQHSSSCYHSHSDSCYHSHVDSCYKWEYWADPTPNCPKTENGDHVSGGTTNITLSDGSVIHSVCSACGKYIGGKRRSITCGKSTSTTVCGKTTSTTVCGKTTSTVVSQTLNCRISTTTPTCGY